MKISCIVLTLNEEKMLSGCLESVKFADEIIVIDNRSADQTRQIAENFNCRVFDYSGLDFSAARNLGAEKAKYDWLLYIDADERVSKELAREIKQAVSAKQSSGYPAYQLERKNYFFQKPFPYRDKMVRLIRKDALISWIGKIHETAKVKGVAGILKNPLSHYTHRNLEHMVEKTNQWSDIEAQLRFKSGHPQVYWWRFPRIMLTAFWDSYINKAAYKVGAVGLIESLYQSFSAFITYAKLWEKQINQKKH